MFALTHLSDTCAGAYLCREAASCIWLHASPGQKEGVDRTRCQATPGEAKHVAT